MAGRKAKLYFSGGTRKRKKPKRGHIQREVEKHIRKQSSKSRKTKSHISMRTGRLHIRRSSKDSRKHESFARMRKEFSKRLDKERDVASVERVPTGIKGLDPIMGDGFVKKSVNMIAGGSGTGKSIFSMEFLVNGIEKYGEHGVYISFEESPEKIIRDTQSFGWDLEEKIKKKQMAILFYTPEQIEKVLETGAGTVRDIIEGIGAKRLVVDSVTAFLLLHDSELDRRKILLKLFDMLAKWGCTSILIAEQEQNPSEHHPHALEFEVDSILLMYYIKRGDVRQRAMEILKMRATHHYTKIFPVQITESGIVVYPEESIF